MVTARHSMHKNRVTFEGSPLFRDNILSIIAVNWRFPMRSENTQIIAFMSQRRDYTAPEYEYTLNRFYLLGERKKACIRAGSDFPEPEMKHFNSISRPSRS